MILSSIKTFSRRPLIDECVRRGMIASLAKKIAPFNPSVVVYIEEGGQKVGKALARKLDIPARGIDISYPLSRALNQAPAPLRALLWPVKEMVYKVASPGSNSPFDVPLEVARLVLVDDSASSGKTILAAVRMLELGGIGRERIRTATLRCGRRARRFVDFFESQESLLRARR